MVCLSKCPNRHNRLHESAPLLTAGWVSQVLKQRTYSPPGQKCAWGMLRPARPGASGLKAQHQHPHQHHQGCSASMRSRTACCQPPGAAKERMSWGQRPRDECFSPPCGVAHKRHADMLTPCVQPLRRRADAGSVPAHIHRAETRVSWKGSRAVYRGSPRWPAPL